MSTWSNMKKHSQSERSSSWIDFFRYFSLMAELFFSISSSSEFPSLPSSLPCITPGKCPWLHKDPAKASQSHAIESWKKKQFSILHYWGNNMEGHLGKIVIGFRIYVIICKLTHGEELSAYIYIIKWRFIDSY